MKYKDLIKFEPINEVVKFDRLGESDYRSSLIRNFVFSDAYANTIIPEICRNLDYTSTEDTFGLQIVGNYGTGKSHLMSLFSLIAEDKDFLSLVNDTRAQRVLKNIAGKYKVIRFELGNDDELWKIICYQIDKNLKEFGVDYKLADDDSQDSYYQKLARMMAQFEAKYPDKGLMVVIDEMLSYLMGRSDSAKINRDLAVLQALGQMSDHSRFRMVFGVQEMIYVVPELQFAADMLNHVNARFRQIEITQQDVQFVVQKRLLAKNDDQKHAIQQHLSKFEEFFPDMHARIDTYVELFPVHPSFFSNFQLIKIGQSHRDVLKTLTRKFEEILEHDVPENKPELICYDSYWKDLQSSEMQIYPDISRVNGIMQTIHSKIDENFTGARLPKAALAHRIADACAIKILQESLDKTNGATAETLVDDLCHLDETCFNREFLVEHIKTTATQIITATVGQYFEMNSQEQFHLRIEGGVNYEQRIKDFAQTMSPAAKDGYFYNFLAEFLPIEEEQYRPQFKIYRHRLTWTSHKTMLDGYIFMGTPEERSTTHPEQHFYIYFMPIFGSDARHDGVEPDSVYFHLDKLGDEFKELISLYGSACSLKDSVDSSQQGFYNTYKQRYADKLKPLFDQQFRQKCEVIYQGELQTISPQMMTGASKIDIVSNIASTLLEDNFNQKLPDFPKFTLLSQPMSMTNRVAMLRLARQRIVNNSSSHDGDAILAGLGLLKDNQLSIENSIYAQNVKQMLDDKGPGQVLNRSELLEQFWEQTWLSRDYHIDADLEFVVLSAMVALGHIEIHWPGGKNINAGNLGEIVAMPANLFYEFTHVSHPRGMNVAAVRELLLGILGRDLTTQLENPAIYAEMVEKARDISSRAVTMAHNIQGGISLEGVDLLTMTEAHDLGQRLTVLSRTCDQSQQYNTPARMRNIRPEWTQEQLQRVFACKSEIKRMEELLQFRSELQTPVNYLKQALRCMVTDEQKSKVNDILDKLPQIIEHRDSRQQVDAYKAELNKLIEEYADWYLDQYNKMHLTALDAGRKNRILDSPHKHTLDSICGADHAHDYIMVCDQYNQWCNKMSQLTQVESYVTRDAILQSPFVGGFNPSMYQGSALPSLNDLQTELDEMYDAADDTLRATFNDPAIVANVDDVLLDADKDLLNRYTNGAEELSTGNARRLMEVLQKLQRGIRRIEISMQDLRTRLGHASAPRDAKRAFNAFIDEVTAGYDEDNVRIIIK